MNKSLLILTFAAAIVTQACNSQISDKSKQDSNYINKQAPFYTRQLPEGNPRMTKDYDSTKIEQHYPFILYNDSSYMIAAEIEDLAMFDKYNPIFEKYGYSGNGYSWEGHIIQILKKVKSDLIIRIMFDPEAGGFYAFADSERSQREIVKILSPIFSDIPKLEAYLKSADRSKIDD